MKLPPRSPASRGPLPPEGARQGFGRPGATDMPTPGPTEQHRFDSPLGSITVAATAKGLRGAWLAGQRHWPDNGAWPRNPGHPLLQAAQAQLLQFLHGQRRTFDLPLDLSAGTPFQQAVWRALLAIPFGATTRYGALARQLERPQAARAIGAAVGRNPLSIIVPCHRVLGADGTLTGYAGGLDRKLALLQLEGVELPASTVAMHATAALRHAA